MELGEPLISTMVKTLTSWLCDEAPDAMRTINACNTPDARNYLIRRLFVFLIIRCTEPSQFHSFFCPSSSSYYYYNYFLFYFL
jgi:hypothetical protein